jgi:hypothetical protein
MARARKFVQWVVERQNSPRDLIASVFVGFWLGLAVYALIGPDRFHVPEAVQVVLVAVVGAAVGVTGAITAASIGGTAAIEAARLQTAGAHAVRFSDRKRELAARVLDEMFLLVDYYRVAASTLELGNSPPNQPESSFFRLARELRLVVDRQETFIASERLVDAMAAIRRVVETRPYVFADITPLVSDVRTAHIAFETEARAELGVPQIPVVTR